MAKHKQAEVLRAISDGKVGQWHDGDGWIDGSESVNPLKFPSLNWRVKPEPKPDVVRYYACADALGFNSLDGAKNSWPDAIGYFRWLLDGETGKLKSVEIVE
mgnify:CR=1 FL=1